MRAFSAWRVTLAGGLVAAVLPVAAQFPHAPEGEKEYPPKKEPDKDVIQKRPGDSTPLQWYPPPIDPKQIPMPALGLPREIALVPDRWRIMQALGFKFPWYDPYNQNFFKGDLPINHPKWVEKFGTDWFVSLSGISDSLAEFRRLPTPVGPQTTTRPGSLDVFGRSASYTFAQSFIVSASLIKGNTTFKPPDYEFRFAPAFNYNFSRAQEIRALRIDPQEGQNRRDKHFGIQEAFVDVHIRNVSDRYDFDSYRIGIQPFITDFRGFLFQDVPFGFRLFGIRDNNQIQYNLAAFQRIEKDTNSGLNDLNTRFRKDFLLAANAYRQDFPFLGFTSQATAVLNINREGNRRDFYNANGFLERPAVFGDNRPHNYDVLYIGYNADGHVTNANLGRYNITASVYAAVGRDSRSQFTGRSADIRAGFAALELSRDFSWARVRASLLAATGDKNPFDNKHTGFDAIQENPQFAGADTSFWIRQAIPLIGGGGVALSGRNGVLASLRSSKDLGQSNFINPGTLLAGMGGDFDLTPNLRVIGNVNYLRFADTTVLGVLRNQKPPSRNIGVDASVSMQYRPFQNQNVILNASAAMLVPNKSVRQLFDEGNRGNQYSVLANLVLTY